MIKIRKNKKSQITIFIILGILIFVVIALFFIIKNPPQFSLNDDQNPQSYIESCAKEATEEAIDKMLPRGGDVNPKGSVLYEGIERTYLCYTAKYYESCINQRPDLIKHLEDEITNDIRGKISSCFDNIKNNFDESYDVSMGEMYIKTKLYPKQILVDIKRDFEMRKDESSRKFDEFKVVLVHPLYELSSTAIEITNQEAHLCNFDYLGFMIIYPKYDLDKFETGDGDTIYTVRDRSTNKEFIFAIRSCVLPPGILV